MADEKNKKKTVEVPIETLANLTQRVENLESENKTLKEHADVAQVKIETLEELINTAPEASAGSVKIESEPTKKEKPKIPDAIKVGRKSVTFKLPAFRIEGVKMLAQDAVKDDALMKEIVEKYPGLVEVH